MFVCRVCLQTLRQVFESQLDKRDEVIRRLFREIEDGDEQHNIAVRTHIENLERMVGTSDLATAANRRPAVCTDL